MNAYAGPPPTTHFELLSRWRTYADLSRDLERKGIKITPLGVARWGQNDSIPGEYWHPVSMLAEKEQHMRFGACLEMLAAYAYEALRRKHAADAEAEPGVPPANDDRPHDATGVTG